MRIYSGVAMTDGKNRKNHIIPLSTILNAYHDSWNTDIPMSLGHDRTKTIGYTRFTGVYMEPGKAYVTNETSMLENSEEYKKLYKVIMDHDNKFFCEDHKEELNALIKKLGDKLSSNFRVAPVGQAVAIGDKDIVRRLFPEWTEKFKDGLVDAKELEPIYTVNEDGSKGILIPGLYLKDGFLLFAHQFFRRSLSIVNTTNEEFFISFEKMREVPGVNLQLSIDLNMVGLPDTEQLEAEYQYIRGPHFNDDLKSIPEGVTCHDNERYDNAFSDVFSTQFYWHLQDGKRTFECEELCSKENISEDGGHKKLWGCRYVHSMINPNTGLPTHLDGAIRIYDDEQIVERIDTKTDISKCGKNSRYLKLWRIDNDFSVAMWKELISSFYRENTLIGEYFGGIDEKYEEIQKEDNNCNKETPLNRFEYMEMNKGDGIRILFRYMNEFEIKDDVDIDTLYIKGILDAESITLFKYLKRKGLKLSMPGKMPIDFNDMIYNFPTLYCKDEYVVDQVIEAIKELCQIWISNEDNRLISFGVMVNTEKGTVHISFAGHINDFAHVFNNIAKFSEITIEEWLDNIYQINNEFKTAENHPNKIQLIHDGALYFTRHAVKPDKIQKVCVENGTRKLMLKCSKIESKSMHEHGITMVPAYRIKKDICLKCGIEYRKCKCVKFIDKDADNVIVEADFIGIICTNRRDVVSEKLKITIEILLEQDS